MLTRSLLVGAAALVLAGCGRSHPVAPDPPGAQRTIDVTSPAFGDGRPIPASYTCKGAGVSPELSWSRVPAEAGSLALVVDDPDAPAGDYVHWVVTGIPPGSGGTNEGSPPPGSEEQRGSGGEGWRPPCPPSGTHHYRFTVYALPSGSSFAVSGDSVSTLLDVIADHAIAWGRLTGTVAAAAD